MDEKDDAVTIRGLAQALTTKANEMMENAIKVSAETHDAKEKWLKEVEEINKRFKIGDGIIELNVGGVFFATYKATLCKYKDTMLASMFSGRHELVKDRTGRFFIDRDPEPFGIILTFLRTDRLFWPKDTQKLSHLKGELDFFGLTEAAEGNIQLAAERVTKLGDGSLSRSGTFWRWNKITHLPSDSYQLTNSGDTIALQLDGNYLVDIRTCCVSSANYMAILYVNGGPTSQAHANSYTQCSHSFHINEIFSFKAGDRLQVHQTYNGSTVIGNQYNQWSIERLPNPTPLAKLIGTSLPGSGKYWTWAKTRLFSNIHFRQETTNNVGDTLVIALSGWYKVKIRTACTGGPSNSRLYVNGSRKAYSFSSNSRSYANSFVLNELFHFDAGDKVRVQQYYENAALTSKPHDQLSIIGVALDGKEEEKEPREELLKIDGGSLESNGNYWSWNGPTHIGASYSQTATSQTRDTIVVNKEGWFHVDIRTTCTSGANCYSALYINGTEMARSYSSSSSNQLQSFHINELFHLRENDKLRLYQTYTTSAQNGAQYNQWSMHEI